MLERLAGFHPLVIEGMSGYDPRDPEPVAQRIVALLGERWLAEKPSKPPILVIQGDPLEQRGISAITRLVADAMDIPRALVFLDAHIADYHKPNADFYRVEFEVAFSALVDYLQSADPGVVARLEEAVGALLRKKNARRESEGRPALRDYYFDFAMLQEVTKAACHQICGDVTLVHTSEVVVEHSVSSFYTVGLELGLIDPAQIVSYREE